MFFPHFVSECLKNKAQIARETIRSKTPKPQDPGPRPRIFFFPKQVCTLFVWDDLDREQISVFDLNSDEIYRSVHYVHHMLEQKKKSWK